MNQLRQQPKNTNTQLPNHYKLVFPKVRNLEYFCQDVQLPSVSFPPIPNSNPFVDMYVPGDKLKFDPLIIEFKVDEEFRVYEDIFSWMVGLTFPHEFEDYNLQNKKGKYADGSLIAVPSSNDTETKKPIGFRFVNMFPFYLGGIRFSTTDTGTQIMTTQAQFAYTLFDIIR